MIRHIVAWKIKDDVNKEAVKQNIKKKLEALNGVIAQIMELEVKIHLESTSTHDLVLMSAFQSMDDLKNYAQHPNHVKIAEEDIKPFVSDRFCVDYEV